MNITHTGMHLNYSCHIPNMLMHMKIKYAITPQTKNKTTTKSPSDYATTTDIQSN